MTFLFLSRLEVLFYGDKAYNAYAVEDEDQTARHLYKSYQKEKFKRKYESFVGDGISFIRNRIESAFSLIKQGFPVHIHACHLA